MRRLALLVGLLLACPVVADEPPIPGESLFPLKVGNVWTYKVSGQEERFIIKALRQEMVGSQTCVLMEATLKDKVVATEHLAFTKDGLCRFRAEKEDVLPPVCVLRLPATRGVKWEADYVLGGRSASVSFTIGVGDRQVPAGRYRVTTVSAEVTEGPRTVFTSISYADGVGIVRQTISEGKQRLPYLTIELEKFEQAK